jgi:hypothetical protein
MAKCLRWSAFRRRLLGIKAAAYLHRPPCRCADCLEVRALGLNANGLALSPKKRPRRAALYDAGPRAVLVRELLAGCPVLLQRNVSFVMFALRPHDAMSSRGSKTFISGSSAARHMPCHLSRSGVISF